MKYLFVLCGLLFFLSVTSCSEDNPSGPSQTIITGKVLYANTETPAEGAIVYLVKPPMFMFVDSLQTSAGGRYEFEAISPGEYCLTAALYGGVSNQDWTHVSPMSEDIAFDEWMIARVDDIYLHEVFGQATICGRVTNRDSGEPVDTADVVLHKFAGSQFVECERTKTNDEGTYSFTNVATGNYYVFAQCVSPYSPPDYIYYWRADTDLFFCDGIETHDTGVLELGEIFVRKPAVYIYPDRDAYFDVELIFKNGTVLTSSIPEYGTGWNVFVEESGRIDQQYDYLFYEANAGGVPALANGWCLRRVELTSKLRVLLTRIGLNAKEAAEFVEYWRDYLTDYDCYRLYPQFNDALDEMVELKVTPEPDAMLRVWLYFEGCTDCGDLPPPQLPEFHRGTITVIEWGGVLLN
jgi:hypothetical protein